MASKALKEAKLELLFHYVTITRKSVTGEYRVNLEEGTEATAYYTTDLEDAVATGKRMRDPSETWQLRNWG